MDLAVLQHICYQNSREAGWWLDDNSTEYKYLIATKLALIHSEVSEALEALRKNLPSKHILNCDAFAEELADIIIRTLDLAEYHGYNMDEIIQLKLEYNKSRLDHQLSHRNAPGGKAF